MATLASNAPSAIEHERQFFLFMSLLLIAAALLGFGYFQYAGISSWGAPWWVHVHAVSQMGWLGFFALQNTLIVRGDVALHRRLGVFGAFYGAWLVLIGMSLSIVNIATGSGDRMFPPAHLLALNGATMLTFAGLFVAALLKRGQSDWHKRLMLSAVAALSLPSFGRILIMLDVPSTLNRTLIVLSIIVIGMVFDWRTRGNVHPAYIWGAGAVVVMGGLIAALPLLPQFVGLAASIAG